MIRICTPADTEVMYEIVNTAAKAYAGVIPPDCYHEPYMLLGELQAEMAAMTFFGWDEAGELLGFMGIQPVRDVTLIRHAYVRPEQQGQGIGGALLRDLIGRTRTRRLLVGTWAAAHWAIAFYQRHGFRLLPDKDALLQTYWHIPARQVATSVVLGLDIPKAEKLR
ncbi:MAG: GNAT family N-acetyltransferase [Anaerolineae bacterium]|nr:GNAT family N-acetyltransferase [Anaerolineae bacterium]